MNLLEGLTDQPKQETRIVLADGSNAVLLLEYRPNQLGWFYDLSVGDFAAKGQRLATSPNALRKFRKLLSFGIAVVTAGNAEPINQTDLADGTASLYLLDADDVAAVEAAVYPGN